MLRTTRLLCLLMLGHPLTWGQSARPHKPTPEMCWWYNKPATKYWEGMPVGTGRFAAMVGGRIQHEIIPFNEETLWSGGPYNPNNAQGPAILAQTRNFIIANEYVKATEEAEKLGSTPRMVQHYQPMGVLHVEIDGEEVSQVENYRRKLSMDSALVTITYRCKGVDFKREIFASYPDQILVMRLTASKPGSINLKSWLTSLQPSASTKLENGAIQMEGTTVDIAQESYKGHVMPAQIKWMSQLNVLPQGGKRIYLKTGGKTGNQIQLQHANAVTILLGGATNWRKWNDISADEKVRCQTYLHSASKHTFSALKQRHLRDYMPLFSAYTLNLGDTGTGNLTTTERMRRLRLGGEDPLFMSQYVQFGRYLLLADAREKTLAFNNHNVWLDNMEGRWQGRWTLNINIQECYWPVESTNLARLNESLLLFTENLAEAGSRTANQLYGCRGWTAHHGTDIWFNTAPTDGNPQHATWPMGGAWLMQQLYDHYTYDPDTTYLARIYPLLKGSAQFFLDFLLEEPRHHWLVTAPSTSPENSFLTDSGQKASVSMGSSMDSQLIRNLFRNCLQATKILGKDDELGRQLSQAIPKLPPHQIGQYGQLQEWLYDFRESEVGHRHLSHLFASYPDDDITLRKTPELAQAVKVVLRRRGDINKGWSGAWKINQYARLEEPEEAYNLLKGMLTEISIHPRPEDSEITPSYEGNQGIQGVTAGVAELLMQSHSGEISILPALPKAWSDGKVTGLRAKGGYELAIAWTHHALQEATILAHYTSTCKVRTKGPVRITANGKPIGGITSAGNLYTFAVSAGQTIYIRPK